MVGSVQLTAQRRIQGGGARWVKRRELRCVESHAVQPITGRAVLLVTGHVIRFIQ